MKLIIKINGTDVLMSVEDFDRVLDVLHTCEKVVSEYMGTGKGDDGGNYTMLIRPLNTTTDIQTYAMHEGVYVARKLRTQAYDETKTR